MRLSPVSFWRAVTVAPSTTAPLGLVTVPCMLPVICWARRFGTAERAIRHTNSLKIFMRRAFRDFVFEFFEFRVTLDGARESGNHIKVLALEACSSVDCALLIDVRSFLRRSN